MSTQSRSSIAQSPDDASKRHVRRLSFFQVFVSRFESDAQTNVIFGLLFLALVTVSLEYLWEEISLDLNRTAAVRISQEKAAALPGSSSITHQSIKRQPQHDAPSISAESMRNPQAVEKAIAFILSAQPEGAYILTTPGGDDIVHMDVAHSVIALAKADRVVPAMAAMNWLLARMTRPEAADARSTYSQNGQVIPISYVGSFWDHYTPDGHPRTDLTRGRAEGIGLTLIAIYSLQLEDRTYLDQIIDGQTVAEYVALAAGYISSATIQEPDGRFNHRPDYRVSFAEEGARMSLGLQLAARMLDSVGRGDEAKSASQAAGRGMRALGQGDGVNPPKMSSDLNIGMSYDHYALGIWGLNSAQSAAREIESLKEAGLLLPDGVRNYDWQLNQTSGLDRLRFWLQLQTIGPSETFDYAIACLTAGDFSEAERIQKRWLALQRPDGGFPGAVIPVIGLPTGEPTVHAAARFIVLERLLSEKASDLQAKSIYR